MAQDVAAKTQIAKVRASFGKRVQGRGLALLELADSFTVFLQLLGDGVHALGRLVVGQRAIHGVLAQLGRGVLEGVDEIAVILLPLCQLRVLRDGGAPLMPGIAGPESDRQRQHRQQQRNAPAQHQHTALPGQPAAR
ncbi:MAG TPA: hypothetical protein VGE33_11935 [Thermomonas sp.]